MKKIKAIKTIDEIEKMAMEEWNKQADGYNQWRELDQDEKDKLILKKINQYNKKL